MTEYSTDSHLNANCAFIAEELEAHANGRAYTDEDGHVVTIRELEQDEPARTLFGMTYDAKLTTYGYSCGIGHFCKTLEEAEEWASTHFKDATKVYIAREK